MNISHSKMKDDMEYDNDSQEGKRPREDQAASLARRKKNKPKKQANVLYDAKIGYQYGMTNENNDFEGSDNSEYDI